MKPMIGLGLAVAAMATGGAALAQADVCADVEEVVAAAHETPPFASFPHYPNRRDGRRMFGFIDCGYYPAGGSYPDEGARFGCGWSGPDSRIEPDELMSRIAQCLPQAVLTGPEYRSPRSPTAQSVRPGGPPYVRIIYIDSGTLRFESRMTAHSRYDTWRFSAYIRDADAETRD